MIKILEDLDPEDHFGIIAFDHLMESWKSSLSRATKKNVSEAMAYVKAINSRGCKQNKNNYMFNEKQGLCFTKISHKKPSVLVKLQTTWFSLSNRY